MNESDIKRHLKNELGLQPESLTIVPLHQHASYRSYYRLLLPEGQSLVVMEIPQGQWSVSEEISNEGLEISDPPYLSIAADLTRKGFPVPRVLSSSSEEGLIVIEDLGDVILERELRKKSLEEKLALYQQAISLLVDLQNKMDPRDDDCIAFKRHFTVKLLHWELDHFFEYGIEKRLDKTIDPEDRTYFNEVADHIATTLTKYPQVFVHRDFQSRNLMQHQNKLWIIDFQDALMGPISYDLVALLRDSYIVLDRRLKEELIDEYLRQQQERYQKTINRDEFHHMFNWTTIQRKLKDAGRFVFIDREKDNPNFLQYIPASLQYVREALAREPELKEFYQRLKPYVPEWS